jgi:hypothetical protein
MGKMTSSLTNDSTLYSEQMMRVPSAELHYMLAV